MALLDGRLSFMPQDSGEERWYTFSGAGTLGRVLDGAMFPTALVAPTGDDPAWTFIFSGVAWAA